MVESSVKLTHKGKIGGEGVVGLTVKVGGPRGMIVEGLELVANADDKEVKMRSSSLEGAQFPEGMGALEIFFFFFFNPIA